MPAGFGPVRSWFRAVARRPWLPHLPIQMGSTMPLAGGSRSHDALNHQAVRRVQLTVIASISMRTGLLAVVAPELARQWGIPQAKVPGEDLWDHTCRTVDAASPDLADGVPLARVAALVHDIGKLIMTRYQSASSAALARCAIHNQASDFAPGRAAIAGAAA